MRVWISFLTVFLGFLFSLIEPRADTQNPFPEISIDVLVVLDAEIFGLDSQAEDKFIRDQFKYVNDTVLPNTGLGWVNFNVVYKTRYEPFRPRRPLAGVHAYMKTNAFQNLREAYEADIIVAFAKNNAGGESCGVADSTGGDLDDVVVVAHDCLISSTPLALAHELGHILGATHAAGWYGGAYRTVMQTGCQSGDACLRVPYFSSDKDFYAGGPIGDGFAEYDNTKTIAKSALEIARKEGADDFGSSCEKAIPVITRTPRVSEKTQGLTSLNVEAGTDEIWGYFYSEDTNSYNFSFWNTNSRLGSGRMTTELYRSCADELSGRMVDRKTDSTSSFSGIPLRKGDAIFFKTYTGVFTPRLTRNITLNMSTEVRDYPAGDRTSCPNSTELEDYNANPGVPGRNYKRLRYWWTRFGARGKTSGAEYQKWYHFTAPKSAEYQVRFRPNTNFYTGAHPRSNLNLRASLYWEGCDNLSSTLIAEQNYLEGDGGLEKQTGYQATFDPVSLKKGDRLYIRTDSLSNNAEDYMVGVDEIRDILDEAIVRPKKLTIVNIDLGKGSVRASELQIGDQILLYEDQSIRSANDLRNAISKYDKNSSPWVYVTIQRRDKTNDKRSPVVLRYRVGRGLLGVDINMLDTYY